MYRKPRPAVRTKLKGSLTSIKPQMIFHFPAIFDYARIAAYSLKTYKQRSIMPRVAIDDNQRMNLRVTPVAKAKLMRAAALRHTDLTDFVTQTALREAEAVIAASEVVTLSERDSLLVLNLLENPPAPNAKLRAAIAAMPKPAE
jgi:uncharacterized protein (DUF1778 family)